MSTQKSLLPPLRSLLTLFVTLSSAGGVTLSSAGEALAKESAQLDEPTDEPTDERVEATRRDLELLVSYQERLDWISDEGALNKMQERLLEVSCQVERGELERLERALKAEVGSLSMEERWRGASEGERGRLREQLADALHKERVLLALRRALTERERCPFWLAPREDFRGVHRDAGRAQLMLETMGSLQVVGPASGNKLGGSAQGRVFGVWGMSLNTALGVGFELGGASTFPKGDKGRVLSGMPTVGLPLMLRWWAGPLRLDTEVAAVARFPEGTSNLWGARLAQGVGVSTLRVAGFLPHVMLWVGYELYQRPNDQDPLGVVRVGTRLGLSWGEAHH